MPSNPLTPQEQYDILINRSLTPRDGVTTDTYMAAGYILMPPATVDGPVKWRLFDAAYVKTGIIDPNRLGTGATGAGNLYLADDGTWKVISGAPGVGDMLKSTYDTDNSGVVDNAEGIATIGRNSTGVTLYKGTVVYISGSTGNRPNFVKAQANSEATSAGTFGVIRADIPNNSDGYAVTIGVIDTLDTRSSAPNPFTDVTLVDGDTIYLHPTIAGYVTNVKPSAPNHLVYVGKVTRTSPTNGTIVYRIQNGYELDELHDVAIASKANNDLLVYESATNLWKNKTFSAIFGGTPLVTVPTLDQVTTAGNTTTNAITVGGLTTSGNIVFSAYNRTIGSASYPASAVYTNDLYSVNNIRSGGGTNGLSFYDNGGTLQMRIWGTGNVSINSATDAGYKLDVNGTGRFSGGANQGAIFGSGQIVNLASDAYMLATSTTGKNAGYTANRFSTSEYASFDLLTGASMATGWSMQMTPGNTALQFVDRVNSATRLALLVGGNIGIGTTNPSYRLDVQGTTTAHAISTQVGLNFNPVLMPTTGSLALVASAGNVNLGLHYYYVTFTTALGETNPYQIGSITTTSGNQQVTVTIPVSTDSRVTGRKLYRTKAGAWFWETFNLATIAENTSTTYTDNIADASLTGTNGTGFYQVNTTHRAITVSGIQALVLDQYATYLGVNAGGGVTSGGGNNTFIGYNAGRYSYTSNQSVAIGNSALSAQTAGGNNIGIGSQAGGFTTGNDNIAIGRNAAVNISTGSSNTIVGSFTWNLGSVTGKDGNTGLGYRVGSNNTGNYNLFLGYDAGYYVTGSNQILLDTVSRADEATAKSSALIYGVTSATASSQILSLGGGGNVGIGTLSPTYRLDVQGTTLAASSVRVQGSFDINPLAAPSAIGGFTLSAGTNLGVGAYYYFVVFVTALGETSASNTLTVTTTTGNTTVNLTGIPVSSDPRVTARKLYRTKLGGTSDNQWFLATISDNVTTTYTDSIADASLTGVGLQAYKVNTTARYFTVSGVQGMVIDQNLTALGKSAGNAIITSNGAAVRTVLVGAFAGQSITTGTANVIVGQAGANINTGGSNTLMGDLAGYVINSGSYNSIFGAQAGRFLTIGGTNLILGASAGRYLADGTTQFTSGNNNVIVGPDIRMSTITDSNSIVVGWDARGLGSNTTVLGNSSTTFTSIPAGNMTIGGTTNAGYKLDVQGTVRTTGALDVAGDYTLRADNGAANVRVGRFKFVRGTYDPTGVGASIDFWRDGASYGGTLAFSTNPGTAGDNAAERMRITTGGNVGIGTIAPTQKLEVVGNTKLRGVTFFGSINVPSTPTLTNNSTTGGTLAAGTYYYKVVAMDYFGNTTTASNELAVTTTGSTSSVSISWTVVPGAYNYRIYRGTTSGGQDTYFLAYGTNGNSYTDTGTAGIAGTPPTENTTSYGSFNVGDGLLRTGNILIANNGVGNISSINFDKTTDGPAINVVEYQNDSTMFEFSLADNPDGPDAFHFVMPDWQNPSSGWKPFKFAAFTTQIVGKDTNFWSSFSMPSSTPYYTTNDNRLTHAQLRYDPYTSTSYNLVRDAGTGTGNLNVDVTGYTGATYSIYWVTITSPTTFNWGNGAYGGTPVATGVTITGGWQVLGSGVQVRLTGTFVANDRWAFRVFPVPKMGIGTTTPIAPLQVSTTIAASSGTARGVYFNPTVVATANNDTLVGLDIAPTFTPGAFTGVTSWGVRVGGSVFLKDDNSSIDFINQNGRLYSGGGVFTISNGAGADATDVLRFGHTNSTGTRATVIAGQIIKFQRGGFSTTVGQIFGSTGNWVVQNGGTFTDAGYRLDVNGTFRAQGSITATLANSVASNLVYYNSSTGLLTYGAVPTPTTFQIDYDYNIVGVKNGVNVVFTTSANFVLTTTRVYLNGQRLTRGVGYDYVETGTNQVTFANPLNPTDQIIIEYQI